jgi:hypothetical protein
MQKAKTVPGWEIVAIPLGLAIFQHGKKVAHTCTSLGKEAGASIAQQIVSASDPRAALNEALRKRTVRLFDEGA